MAATYTSIHTGDEIDTRITDSYIQTQVNNILSSYFVTQSFTNSNTLTINANSYGNYTIDISKSGYTPLGIVGLTGSGTGQLGLVEFFLSGTNAIIYYSNSQSTAKTISRMTVTVLYKKS